jgi:tripartite motif-containing protein 9/67
VSEQCEALIAAIHSRREFLLDAIRLDKDSKIRILKVKVFERMMSGDLTCTALQDQQTSCTGKLQQTTGLIQFCIEALKETDSAAFLQVQSRHTMW